MENETTTSSTTPQEPKSVQRVAVRAPPFYEQMPEIWFIQIESQFALNNIKDDNTKFHIAMTEMTAPILHQISDAVINPPAGRKYENFKEKVLDRFSMSEQTKIKKLLSEFTLGDRAPSHLLEEMQRLATKGFGEDVLQTLWLECLPENVRGILAASDGNLASLAKLADRVIEMTGRRQIAQVTRETPNDRLSRLEKKFDEFIKTQQNDRQNTRPRSKSRSKSVTKDRSKCWYHNRFGDKATKCSQPCSFESEN